MRTSELIQALQERLAAEGDLPVYYEHDVSEGSISWLEVREEERPRVTPWSNGRAVGGRPRRIILT